MSDGVQGDRERLIEPETPVQTTAAPTPVQPKGPCVVVSYACSVVYGPYPADRAEELATELNDNGWKDEYWLAAPVGRLPGEPVSDEEQKQKLFRVLERRQTQPCPLCGSLEPGSHNCDPASRADEDRREMMGT